MTLSPVTPLGAELPQADGTAAQQFAGTHACWLCGTKQPAASMVPDGGRACADVYWYCADTLACTQRWTRRRRPRAAGGPARESPLHGEHH